MASSKPVLYSYWNCPCSWRVRIALNLKGLEYETKSLDPSSEKDMNNPEFVKLNPARRIPVLVIDGNVLTESLAIIEYLDETYPTKPLLPKDPVVRAQVKALTLFMSCQIQPLLEPNVVKSCNAKESGYGDKWAKHWLEAGLKDLETMLLKSESTYCFSINVTMPDLCVPPLVYTAKTYGLNMTPYATLLKINGALSRLPEFVKAEPDNQPGAASKPTSGACAIL